MFEHLDGALRATDIAKSFGALRVLDSITVEVHRDEVVGLLGPNGAGKSTLVNILTGYEREDAGTVTLDTEALDGLSPAQRARVGLARTFQSARLFGGLTVAENAALGALGVGAGRREADARASAALELLGISDYAKHLADELSHGVSRLVGLARAVTARPTYLVMDEPAAGLSEHEVPNLLSALAAIRQELGCGMLLIDHNVGLVAQACGRVVVLAAGSVLFDGDPEGALADEGVRTAYLGTSGHDHDEHSDPSHRPQTSEARS